MFPDAAGTAISPGTVREYALEAGFTDVQILDRIENPFWRFYRLVV